jgi:hypothetical protein
MKTLTTLLLLGLVSLPALAQPWSAPACDRVAGTAAVTFTRDEGATLAPTVRVLRGTKYTFGLVTLDRPNQLLAAVGSTILRSLDAGCRWTLWAELSRQSGNALLFLTAAPGGRAYAWELNGDALFILGQLRPFQLRSPATSILGLGVDPSNARHARLMDSAGQMWETTDFGQTWSRTGTPAVVDPNPLLYRAIFDPRDLNHVVVGMATDGAVVTFDGGASWLRAGGFAVTGGRANIFTGVISPVDSDVVWVEGIDLSQTENPPASGRHIYRSTDGGISFAPVVDQSAEVTLVNGPVMAAHPTDPNVLYFVFGTSFQSYGTDLFRYDAGTGLLTKTHNAYDDIGSIAFNPAVPSVMYLGLVTEEIQ